MTTVASNRMASRLAKVEASLGGDTAVIVERGLERAKGFLASRGIDLGSIVFISTGVPREHSEADWLRQAMENSCCVPGV